MKVLIIGYGSIGKRHIDNLISLTNCKIIVCTKQKQDNYLKKRNCTVISSITNCIKEKPDIAFITNETKFHVNTAIKLAKFGIPLFIEKPLSNSMNRVNELESIVKENKIVTMVGCNFRFHPCIKRLKKLIASNKIGKIISVHSENGSFLPDWHPYENYSKGYAGRVDLGGGAALTNIHEIDYLYWLFGNVKEVYSIVRKISNLKIDADDFSLMLLQFKNKIIANIHLNFFENPPSRYCKIIGNNGIIFCNLLTNEIKIYSSKKKKWTKELKLKKYDHNDMYIEEIRHFLNCVRTKKMTINSISNSIHSLQIVLNAKKSSKLKKPITMK